MGFFFSHSLNELKAGLLFSLLDILENGVQIVVEAGSVSITYSANLVDPEPAYETLVNRMMADGMNCVFTFTDVKSNVNLAQAMNNRGVWPPGKCKLGPQCFSVVWIPFSAYDSTFVRDGGPGALGVTTFLIRGFDPIADAVDYGRELIPRTRTLVAERLAGAEREAA